jgi:hypothetical protein
MRRREGEAPPLVYRTASTFLFGVVALLVAAWFVLDSVGALDRQNARIGAAVTLLAGVLVFALTVRPAVIADDRRVVIRNPFRNIAVPWSRIVHFGVRYSLDVHTEDRTYPTWAVSRSARQRRGSLTPGRPGAEPASRPSFADQAVEELTVRLEAHRQAAPGRAESEEVTEGWSVPMLAALTVALVLLVLAVVVR